MTLSQRERAALKQLFLEVGPEAPTCCEGWKTRDLAVHLLLRETRPDVAIGMFVPAFEKHQQKVTDQWYKRDFVSIVQKWGSGPPLMLKPVDRFMNGAEHFVHHEDVRRAGPFEPRTMSKESQRELYSALKLMGPRLLSRSVGKVVLRPEGDVAFDVIKAGDSTSSRTLVVTGPVGELLLWAFDRPAVGLDFFGDADIARKGSL